MIGLRAIAHTLVIPTGAGAQASIPSFCHSDRSRSAGDGVVEEPAFLSSKEKSRFLRPSLALRGRNDKGMDQKKWARLVFRARRFPGGQTLINVVT